MEENGRQAHHQNRRKRNIRSTRIEEKGNTRPTRIEEKGNIRPTRIDEKGNIAPNQNRRKGGDIRPSHFDKLAHVIISAVKGFLHVLQFALHPEAFLRGAMGSCARGVFWGKYDVGKYNYFF